MEEKMMKMGEIHRKLEKMGSVKVKKTEISCFLFHLSKYRQTINFFFHISFSIRQKASHIFLPVFLPSSLTHSLSYLIIHSKITTKSTKSTTDRGEGEGDGGSGVGRHVKGLHAGGDWRIEIEAGEGDVDPRLGQGRRWDDLGVIYWGGGEERDGLQ